MASPRKVLILAKTEVTQFTDPTPTAGANAILVKNIRDTPLRIETENRNLYRPYFGNSEEISVMEESVLEFDVEIAGSGTAGTEPKYGPLLRACAFAVTTVAVTSNTYNPVSGGFESVTLYRYRDGILYKMTGAQGNVSLEFNAKRIPHYHFRFVGRYVAVSDAAVPASPDFTGFQTPRASIPTWTGTLTIDSYAAKVAAFSVDMGSQVSHAVWMNNETIAHTDRRPTGSMIVEQVTVATYNYFSKLQGANLLAFTLTHGTAVGNRVTVAAPKVQISGIEDVEYEGVAAHRLSLVFNPNTGNDEVTIAAT